MKVPRDIHRKEQIPGFCPPTGELMAPATDLYTGKSILRVLISIKQEQPIGLGARRVQALSVILQAHQGLHDLGLVRCQLE